MNIKCYILQCLKKIHLTDPLISAYPEADPGLLQHPRWMFQQLTVITKCSILNVAAVLDPPLRTRRTRFSENTNIVVFSCIKFELTSVKQKALNRQGSTHKNTLYN